MKSIKELRDLIDFYPQEIASSIRYFKNNNIDWDVFLETKQKNLQRGFVWTIEQKRELINSVLIGRHIPHCALINTIDKKDNKKDLYLVIDGKQRLSTMFDFVDNKFTILIDDKEYFFNELPTDYQLAINNFHFRYYIVNEPWENRITDQQKINWFKFINYAGTSQDKEHLISLD